MAPSTTEQATPWYVAFLRGINVGGRRVTSTQLCAPFETLGFGEVGTFLASGNVAFATDETDDLEARIEVALQSALGFDVDVFIRTAGELARVVAFEPFPPDVLDASDGKVQVTFLRDEPDRSAIETALAHASGQDRLVVAGREWYWLGFHHRLDGSLLKLGPRAFGGSEAAGAVGASLLSASHIPMRGPASCAPRSGEEPTWHSARGPTPGFSPNSSGGSSANSPPLQFIWGP